jgi:hypothetical protein
MADVKDPKAQASGEPQVTIVEDADTSTSNPNDGITVDISKPAAATTAKPSQETHDSELTKMQRRMEYQTRQVEKLTRQVQDLTQNVSATRSVQTQKPASQIIETDDLDQIAEKDWKKAVDILAEKRAKVMLEEYEQKKQAESEKKKVEDELGKSKARVMDRYPQLEDENSDEAQTYVQIINENPMLLSNPYGPELAMYKMEERIKTKPKQQGSDDIEKEIQRRSRVDSVYVPPGQRPSGTRIVLTKAEQQFCDSHNLPYDQFAKMKTFDPARLKEGVEVE